VALLLLLLLLLIPRMLLPGGSGKSAMLRVPGESGR